MYLRPMTIHWYHKPFSSLSTSELYALFQLRIDVFVVEQNCPYQDADGKDVKSAHVFALDETGKAMACSRIVSPGVSYDEVSIGRVATAQQVRGTGVGRELMDKSIAAIEEKYGQVPIRISAQSYLKKFYESFGFSQVSEEYMEDDIPHIEMLRS